MNIAPFIFRMIALAVALYVVDRLVPGISIRDWTTLAWASFILALIHVMIKPILVLLTMPITILTFGLFALVLNALLFWFASAIVGGFEIRDFWSAMWAALLTSIITSILHMSLRTKKI